MLWCYKVEQLFLNLLKFVQKLKSIAFIAARNHSQQPKPDKNSIFDRFNSILNRFKPRFGRRIIGIHMLYTKKSTVDAFRWITSSKAARIIVERALSADECLADDWWVISIFIWPIAAADALFPSHDCLWLLMPIVQLSSAQRRAINASNRFPRCVHLSPVCVRRN